MMETPRQPLNKLAPFQVQDGAFEVTADGSVVVTNVIFKDGTSISSAGAIGDDIDCGTF